MKKRGVFFAAGLALLALVVPGADTNAPPASVRTDAQIETELRAVIKAEQQWLVRMTEELDRIRTGLEKHDESWHPQTASGPPRYAYVIELTKRREALQTELLSRRAVETGKKLRQPTGPRDGVPAAHDP